MHPTHNLNWHECETVLEFLLHHMDQETRGKLIARMPVEYHKLFPSVAPEILLDRVRAAVTAS